MIDIENELYTELADALRGEFPGVFVTGEPVVSIPPVFPCVSISEADNFTPKAYIDSSGVEKVAQLEWQVSVYSNRSSGRSGEIRRILGFLDTLLFSRNFTRDAVTPEMPLNEGKIYWKTATYRAKTDGVYIYRN